VTSAIAESTLTAAAPSDDGGPGHRGSPIRMLTVIAAAALVAIAALSALTARSVVHDQERRLLKERAAEAGLVVSSDFGSIQSTLGSLGAIARLSGSSPAEFTRLATPQTPGKAATPTALVQSTPAGTVVRAAVGAGLTAGEVVTGPRLAAIQQAMSHTGLATTTVLGRTPDVSIGLALGPPQAPPGYAVYEEFSIPPNAAAAEGSAFSELSVAIYVVGRPDPAQLLLTNGPLPHGTVVDQPVKVGTTPWLLVVGARRPLVGSLATDTPWILFAVGLLGAFLVAAVIEVLGRRRDYALGLVADRTSALRASLVELESTQAQLVRQERLAAVGELASTVGHELRNPLGVITNSLYLIRNGTAGTADDRLRRQLATAEREVAAATLIVSDLLDFAKAREPIMGSVDIPALVGEALDVAPPPTGTTVAWQPPSGVPAVAGDRDQLRQVLLNVITNGYDAMPEGGTLRVDVSGDGSVVAVAITDEGPGINNESRDRLFEPFFTTKARGTGLGLAVTDRIVRAHGGTIAVQSPPGQGATFRLELPVDRAGGRGSQ
jgi:signal transduction histidine kinase